MIFNRCIHVCVNKLIIGLNEAHTMTNPSIHYRAGASSRAYFTSIQAQTLRPDFCRE
mgnify:CR=1 FL=1